MVVIFFLRSKECFGEIENTVKFIENENTELKKSTGELKKGIISIAAILNKHGKGELYFGVKNNGKLIGQKVSEKTLRDISQAISSHIEPKILTAGALVCSA
ncbi:ATP-binding protein [bacterium]|nr:ATP-binding protein [bacterium]